MRKLLVLGIWALVGASFVQAASSPSQHRTCFPAKLWSTGSVDARYRPCARVTKVYEDGSTTVAVSDADGTVRYTYSVGAKDR